MSENDVVMQNLLLACAGPLPHRLSQMLNTFAFCTLLMRYTLQHRKQYKSTKSSAKLLSKATSLLDESLAEEVQFSYPQNTLSLLSWMTSNM